MSRKSKKTLDLERLASISRCPDDLFYKVDANDELFETIKDAESGNEAALSDILNILSDAYMQDSIPNKALLYFIDRCIQYGSRSVLRLLIEYADRYNDGIDVLSNAEQLPYFEESIRDVYPIYERIIFKKLLYIVGLPDPDIDRFMSTLHTLSEEYHIPGELYLMSAMTKSGRDIDRERLAELTQKCGISGAEALPCFKGVRTDSTVYTDINSMLTAVKNMLDSVVSDNWCNFRLVMIYEYAEVFMNGDYSYIAKFAAEETAKRKYSGNRTLHELAWWKYALSKISGNDERYASYSEICRILTDKYHFEGGSELPQTDDEITALMREAIYMSAKEEKEKNDENIKLGNVIRHTKNRYSLSATLSGHGKRLNKHMWSTTLSIETELDSLPEISELKIIDVRNSIIRGGVKIDTDKHTTQVILKGEIRTHDMRSPFEVDLILDMSYVSASKCSYSEIKIRKAIKTGNYLTMICQIYLW